MERKTPEEILKYHAPGWMGKISPEAENDFVDAMNDFADQEMLLFADWTIKKGFVNIQNIGWMKYGDPKGYTTQQLLTLYKETDAYST